MFRLLCASANPNWLGFYYGIFEAAGHEVFCRNTIAEAARALDRGPFALLITDLSLGDDSLSLVSIARQHGIPVVVISPDMAKLFRPPYADLYLEPPVAPKELLAIVIQILDAAAVVGAKTQVAVA